MLASDWSRSSQTIIHKPLIMGIPSIWSQSSWGQHERPTWATCWPHEPCYQSPSVFTAGGKRAYIDALLSFNLTLGISHLHQIIIIKAEICTFSFVDV